jgi:predicted nucleic-acid-binding protein
VRAIDTSVILRYLRRDDDRQAKLADQVIAAPCIMPVTVLLETVWVLESYFEVARGDIAGSLEELLDLETVHCEDLGMTRWALERYRHGADIADMLHLIGARGATQFTTFDRGWAKRAGASPPVAVETLR